MTLETAKRTDRSSGHSLLLCLSHVKHNCNCTQVGKGTAQNYGEVERQIENILVGGSYTLNRKRGNRDIK